MPDLSVWTTPSQLWRGAQVLLTVGVTLRFVRFFRVRASYATFVLLLALSFVLAEKHILLSPTPWVGGWPLILAGLVFLAVFDSEISAFLGFLYGRGTGRAAALDERALDEIVQACDILVKSRTGALLAVERTDDLTPYIHKSVAIDARIRYELLVTIFTPPTYLHDGGVILKAGRIAACSAIFPLSQNERIKKDLGTRHRAALGMSEETDALCLVVSEETGTISITDRGRLYYDVGRREFRELVRRLLEFKKIRQEDHLEALEEVIHAH
jgi:diadenylate cyclase